MVKRLIVILAKNNSKRTIVTIRVHCKCPQVLGEYIASAPLTPLIKQGGYIRPIAVGTVWRRLVSKVGAALVGPSLSSNFVGLQFGWCIESSQSEGTLANRNRFFQFLTESSLG